MMTDLLILLKFGFIFFIAIGFGRLWYFFFGQEETLELGTWLLRNILRAALIALYLWFLGAQAGCTRKKNTPVQQPPPPVAFDSARQHLELRVEGSANQVNITQSNAQQTVTDYENQLSKYNSTTLVLP